MSVRRNGRSDYVGGTVRPGGYTSRSSGGVPMRRGGPLLCVRAVEYRKVTRGGEVVISHRVLAMIPLGMLPHLEQLRTVKEAKARWAEEFPGAKVEVQQ